jgi:hypothetical protein
LRQWPTPATRRSEIKEMKRLSIKFVVDVEDKQQLEAFEYALEDLLKRSVLPALNAEIIPLTLSVTKSRN